MMNVRICGIFVVAGAAVYGCAEQEEGDATGASSDVTAQQTASGWNVDAGASTPIDAGQVISGADAGALDAAVGLDAGSSADPCAALTYESFGKPFLQKYCIGCHQGAAASDGIDLSSLRGVQTNEREIDAHAVRTPRSKPMPPPAAPQPSADERKKLGDWLRCGPL